MSYEELVESRKHIGDMTKEELYTYCQGLLDEVWSFEKENDKLHSIIKEVREEVKIYEEQSNDGATNELDNYAFVQRLKKVLDKDNE